MDLEAFAQVSAAGLAGVFTGAAAFMTLAQHPALLEIHRAEFQAPYFRRMYFYAARMQAPMAIGSGLSAMTVYLLQRGRDCGCQNRGGMPRIWLLSGSIMMAIVPYTMTRMLALNRRLTDTKRYKTYGREWLQLMLKRWGELHDVRTGASLIAFTGMLVALACSSQPVVHMPAHVH